MKSYFKSNRLFIFTVLLLVVILILISCKKSSVSTATNDNIMNQYILHYPYGTEKMKLTFDDFDSGIFHGSEALDYDFVFYIDNELIEKVNRNSFEVNVSDFMEVPRDIRIDVYTAQGELAFSTVNEKVMIYNEKRNKEDIHKYREAEVLYLYDHIQDMSVFKNLKHLKAFEFTNGSVGDISSLSELENLKRVYFEYAQGVEDISSLTKLENLEMIIFFECRDLKDISPLSEIESLRYVFLPLCNRIEDISPLSELPNIEYIYTPKNPGLKGLDLFEGTGVILK